MYPAVWGEPGNSSPPPHIDCSTPRVAAASASKRQLAPGAQELGTFDRETHAPTRQDQESSVERIFPDGQPGAGRAPRGHGLFVIPRFAIYPLEKIENERFVFHRNFPPASPSRKIIRSVTHSGLGLRMRGARLVEPRGFSRRYRARVGNQPG